MQLIVLDVREMPVCLEYLNGLNLLARLLLLFLFLFLFQLECRCQIETLGGLESALRIVLGSLVAG